MKRNLHTIYGSWAAMATVMFLLFSSLFYSANAQIQLVQWNFSSYNNTPTASLPQNAGKLVTAVGQNQAAFISAAGTPYDPPYICNGWDVPANTAYFLINFSTLGFSSNTITYFLGAFQFGVKSFQPQYSVAGAAGPWTDFGTAVTFPPAGGDQMFSNVPLPPACDNQPNVWVRLLSTTTTFNTGGDYIDEIEVLGSPLLPLPVNLTNFRISNEKVYNQLNWSTETEMNSSHFELQYSNNGNDFVTIAHIPSLTLNGNSERQLQYSYSDMNPAAGRNYYRLKHADKDGRFTFSKVLDIVNNSETSPVQVYPNPATDVLHVDMMASGEYQLTLQVTDLQGRVVKLLFYEVHEGRNRIAVDMKQVISGVYTLNLYRGNSLMHTQKVNRL